jgi:transcriptional regulator with XRE-family HTH domain
MMYQFTVGELFEALRRVDGLSQVQLAKELDIVQSTISKMERNVSDVITFELVNRMSSLSGTDLRCFQKGYLSNAPKKIKSILPATYTRSAEFTARSVFLLLEEMDKLTPTNIYTEIKINRVYFSFAKLKLSQYFMWSLTQKFGDIIETAQNNILTRLSPIGRTKNINGILQDFNSFEIVPNNIDDNTVSIAFRNPEELNPEFAKTMLKMLSIELATQHNFRYGPGVNFRNEEYILDLLP